MWMLNLKIASLYGPCFIKITPNQSVCDTNEDVKGVDYFAVNACSHGMDPLRMESRRHLGVPCTVLVQHCYEEKKTSVNRSHQAKSQYRLPLQSARLASQSGTLPPIPVRGN